MSTRDDAATTTDSAELAELLPGLADKARHVRQMHALDLIGSDTAERDCARACELLLAERANVTARPLAALHAAGFEVRVQHPALSTLHALLGLGNEEEPRLPALVERAVEEISDLRIRLAFAGREAMFGVKPDGTPSETGVELARLRARVTELEAERTHMRHGLAIIADGASALEAEDDADMRAEIGRTIGELAAKALAAPPPTAPAPEDDMPDPDVFDPDDPGDTVSPEDAERAELLVSLLRRSTAELRALVAPATPALSVSIPHVWDVDGQPRGIRHSLTLSADGTTLTARDEGLDQNGDPFGPSLGEASMPFVDAVHILVNLTPEERQRYGVERTMQPEIVPVWLLAELGKVRAELYHEDEDRDQTRYLPEALEDLFREMERRGVALKEKSE